MTPYTITFIAALVVLCYFLLYGLMNFSNSQTYFNCGKELKRGEFGNSFAAASTSLATVLFFFVTLGLTNGLYILISPISYFFGIYFFNKVMLPKLVKHRFSNDSEGVASIGTTLGAYMYERYNSKWVKNIITSITLLGILAILLIELYVGVDIFNIFIKNEYKEWALVLISIVTFTYTGLGGLYAVVKTDKVQFRYMLVVAFLLVVWLLFDYDTSVGLKNFFPDLPSLSEGLFLPWPLFLNMIFVNFLLIPSLLRNWQLTAAAKNAKEVKYGLYQGLLWTAVISALFVIFGILYFDVFKDTELSLNGILVKMANASSMIVSYILFPLFFTACLMALLSTVDSSLMPVVQSLSYDFSVLKNHGFYKYFIIIFVLLLLTIGLYFIVFEILKFDLIGWLFTIFSLVTISSPAIILGCVGREDIIRTRPLHIVTIVSTLVGLVIALFISYLGNKYQEIWLIQLNTPIAVVFVSISLCVAYFIVKAKKDRQNEF